jgi:glyceraldehyde 3-phosphate dehydrogenase
MGLNMKTKIGINGFGRIGRNAFKIAFDRPDLEIVAVNDLTDTKTLAYLLKHDSNYGTYHHDVSFDEQNIIVNNQHIKVLAEKDPSALPWGDLGVELVIESTGRFTKKEDAEKHIIGGGAKRVIISGPTKSDGVDTIVIGANEDKLAQATSVISNASCTTNSLGAVMAILDSTFGVEKSLLTTVHSYTASQALQDAPAKDLREGRNAAENIVPTTTGAAVAVTLTLPQLKDKFDGLSIRVPTPVVSLSDVTALLKRPTTIEEINEAFKKAAADPYYQGILGVSEEPLVSSDYIGNSHSGIELLQKGNSEQQAEPALDTPQPEQPVQETTHPGDTFIPDHPVEEKPEEPLLNAPAESKEELLPSPESLEHQPQPAHESAQAEGVRRF